MPRRAKYTTSTNNFCGVYNFVGSAKVIVNVHKRRSHYFITILNKNSALFTNKILVLILYQVLMAILIYYNVNEQTCRTNFYRQWSNIFQTFRKPQTSRGFIQLESRKFLIIPRTRKTHMLDNHMCFTHVILM